MNNNTWLRDVNDTKEIPIGYTMIKGIPRQNYDTMTMKFVRNLFKISMLLLTVLIVISLTLLLFLEHNLHLLWSFISSLQLISHLPLMNVTTPSNV